MCVGAHYLNIWILLSSGKDRIVSQLLKLHTIQVISAEMLISNSHIDIIYEFGYDLLIGSEQ